jgi:hypothetical protein
MNKFSRDVVQGMKEAAEFAEGGNVGGRVHVVSAFGSPVAALAEPAASSD